jgi:apolipoprotein D and lipocalin family protein
MLKYLLMITVTLMGASVLSRANDDHTNSLQVVPSIDLSRYTGTWYEIARLPNKFQKDCTGEVSATYSRINESQLKVVNQCRKKNGQLEKAEGEARPASKDGPNTKLEVRFAPAWLSWLPFVWGDYWIIDIAPDYSYSVVGTPDRKYLWVLSRTAQMDEATYQKITEKAAASGFKVDQLIKTKQAS